MILKVMKFLKNGNKGMTKIFIICIFKKSLLVKAKNIKMWKVNWPKNHLPGPDSNVLIAAFAVGHVNSARLWKLRLQILVHVGYNQGCRRKFIFNIETASLLPIVLFERWYIKSEAECGRSFTSLSSTFDHGFSDEIFCRSSSFRFAFYICLLRLHTVSFCKTGHRHTGRCRRHWNSVIHRLSPVPEHSGNGLYLLVPGPDMPDSPAFRHYQLFFAKAGY
jgi:hypothetical protein